MRRLRRSGLAGLLLLGGCKSAFVSATIRNSGHVPISVVELDYPSASFGIQALAPGAEMHYRFKVLGSGQVKLTYSDSQGREHTAAGPALKEGAEGSLESVVSEQGVAWKLSLRDRP